jgi:hypothetical protein
MSFSLSDTVIVIETSIAKWIPVLNYCTDIVGDFKYLDPRIEPECSKWVSTITLRFAVIKDS